MPARVLIAEDSEPLRELFAITFEKTGFVVDTVGNGQEALDYLRAMIPDVVTLDVNMPEVDGLTVLRDIREREATQHIKVILVTANSEVEQSLDVEKADLILIKPVRVADLIRLAERLLDTTHQDD